jgi:hypothetical protein
MKTLLWFLITISIQGQNIKVLKVETTKQVDSIFVRYEIPYRADSLFQKTAFLEIRKEKIDFYVEQKDGNRKVHKRVR